MPKDENPFPYFDVKATCPRASSIPNLQTSTNPSWKMYLHPREIDRFVSGRIMDGTMFEESLQNLLVSKLKEYSATGHKGVFIDIGANIGVHSFAAAANGFETHCFEPMPHNFEVLSCTVSANPTFPSLMHINQVALSDKPGPDLCMLAPSDNQGHAHIAGADGGEDSDRSKCQMVPQVTLDTYWELVLKKKRATGMKVDVEGYEPRVFRGAVQMMTHAPPCFIQMEFFPQLMANFGENLGEFIFQVMSYGYKGIGDYVLNSPEEGRHWANTRPGGALGMFIVASFFSFFVSAADCLFSPLFFFSSDNLFFIRFDGCKTD
jgi:FkbM family methyltransferase